MSPDDTVSAIPGLLIDYSAWALGLDANLERAAHDLSDAIDVLVASRPDPGILLLTAGDRVGDHVFNHALTDRQSDQWVGEVGRAFLRIATQGLPPGLLRSSYDDFLNEAVTASESDLARLVGAGPAVALPPLPADPNERSEWWASLTAAEQQAYLAYDAVDVAHLATPDQLRQAGFGTLQAVYLRQLYLEAGIDPARWDVTKGLDATMRQINEKVYAFYQHVFDADPNVQWAGLAKLVGGEVFGDLHSLDSWRSAASSPAASILAGAEGLAFGGPAGAVAGVAGVHEASAQLSYYETQFLRIQQAIFTDMGPQLVAYLHGGVQATDALARSGAIDLNSATAWRQIASGNLGAGNLGLARHEQNDIVTTFYQQMASHPMTGGIVAATLSKDATSPVPGGTSFQEAVPGGNLADTSDRWRWVSGTMFAEYERFLPRPDATQIIDQPLDVLASRHSISPFSVLP